MDLDHCLEAKLGWSNKPNMVVYSICGITLTGIFLLNLFIPLGVATEFFVCGRRATCALGTEAKASHLFHGSR